MASPDVGAARLLGSALAVVLLTACAPSTADPASEPAESSAPPTSSASTSDSSAPSSSTPKPPPTPVPLATDRGRWSAAVVAYGGGDSPYNYGPTLMFEGGRHRMWWCSQLSAAPPAGDDLLYSESAAVSGPFVAPNGTPATPVLSGSVNGFDGVHTCDPSVIKLGATYYLYYTGAAGDHAHGNAIGVATSPDGVVWTRAAGGKPIVSPSYDKTRENTYGAGQPSVLVVDGWFHLMFTDTTGEAAGWNGAGQFVLRSKDPTFASGVQALGPQGFQQVPDTRTKRTRSVVDAFSADWMYSDVLHAFVIAHETEAGTTLTFWNKEFTANPHPQVHIPGQWREGPGLVRTPLGHAPVSAEDPCGRIAVDVVRATVDGAAAAPTDLQQFGLDLAGVPGCTTEESAAVLHGYAVPSPANTTDLVLDGEVVRIERRSVTDRLAARVLDRRPPIVDELPVVAEIPAGTKALRAPDGQIGLLLGEDKLWVLGTSEAAVEIVTLNSSQLTQVSKTAWDSYEKAGDLRR
ncbi:beta-xylosidase [Saccharothrix deserti]|uniref:beta-xylosidase n=1 Tax=Saccharothrix deserti TaxID=2593674 RepID=UPI00131BA28D|nr:beta-xylosidase [Saccharothrix deserti]